MVFVHAHSTLGGHVHTLATVCHGCTVYDTAWWTLILKVHGYNYIIIYQLLSRPHTLLPKWSTRSFQRVRLWHTLQYAGPPVHVWSAHYGGTNRIKHSSIYTCTHYCHFMSSGPTSWRATMHAYNIYLYITHPLFMLTAIGIYDMHGVHPVQSYCTFHIPLWHGT